MHDLPNSHLVIALVISTVTICSYKACFTLVAPNERVVALAIQIGQRSSKVKDEEKKMMGSLSSTLRTHFRQCDRGPCL